jgi:ATP-binding cassette subfamily F protein 3
MISFSAERLSAAFGADTVFENLSFSIQDGDRLGIVGPNGSGKSTFLKICAAQKEPTSGNIYFPKNKTVGYLDQHTNFSSEATIYQEMLQSFSHLLELESQIAQLQTELEGKNHATYIARFSALQEEFQAQGGYEFRSRAKSILKHLGFTEDDFSRKIDTLSGGQKAKLALGRLLLQKPDLLLLDEPTNHLDLETIQWLEEDLKNYPHTVMVISHDRYFLDRISTCILEIDHQKGTLYQGNYASYVKQKELRRKEQWEHYKNQQKQIAKMEAFIAQQHQWNREKNIIAADSRQKALDRMEKIEKPDEDSVLMHLTFEAALESGNQVLQVKNLQKAYGDKLLIENLTFDVKKGDRLLIIGPNGCGKSTLMKILTQKLCQDNGDFEYGYNVQSGYYDQENQELYSQNSILQELWSTFPTLSQTKIRSTLAYFLFYKDDVEKSVSKLSGGERARLTFAKLMLKKTNLLLLDEPTNHLDLPSKEVLERALSDYQGTMIAVSHDRYFIEKLATRILAFRETPIPHILDFKGNYQEYLHYIENYANNMPQAEKKVQQEFATGNAGKDAYLQQKQIAANQKKVQRRIECLEQNIEDAEQLITELESQMESVATDYLKLQELDAEINSMKNQIANWYDEWDELQKD